VEIRPDVKSGLRLKRRRGSHATVTPPLAGKPENLKFILISPSVERQIYFKYDRSRSFLFFKRRKNNEKDPNLSLVTNFRHGYVGFYLWWLNS